MDQQEKVDACYAAVEDSVALECMKDIVREAEGECKPKLVLLTQELCTPCEEEEAVHEAALKEGVIKKLSVDTEEGMAIAVKNDIDVFPMLVLMDCNDKVIFPTVIPD